MNLADRMNEISRYTDEMNAANVDAANAYQGRNTSIIAALRQGAEPKDIATASGLHIDWVRALYNRHVRGTTTEPHTRVYDLRDAGPGLPSSMAARQPHRQAEPRRRLRKDDGRTDAERQLDGRLMAMRGAHRRDSRNS